MACVIADQHIHGSLVKDVDDSACEGSRGSGDSAAAEEHISAADQAAIDAAMAEETAPTAKSLKCVDCGKLFKNADLANYHAEKSGHENFEESVEEVLA